MDPLSSKHLFGASVPGSMMEQQLGARDGPDLPRAELSRGDT